MLFVQFKEEELGLPGGPVAKTCYSNVEGPGFDPWSRNEIPHAEFAFHS